VIADLLKQVPLFSNLNEPEYGLLAQVMTLRKFPKDCMIIWARDEGDAFFIIQSGEVKVTANASDGREVILSSLGAGDFFGDMSLLDGEPRSANVTTLSPTEALVLRRVDFLRALKDYPSIAIHLMVALVARLRKADHQTANLALLGIADRICQVLVEIAQQNGVETPEGFLIRSRPTHQMIASMSGTARETATRVLKRLTDDGYIRSRGRELMIFKRSDSFVE